MWLQDPNTLHDLKTCPKKSLSQEVKATLLSVWNSSYHHIVGMLLCTLQVRAASTDDRSQIPCRKAEHCCLLCCQPIKIIDSIDRKENVVLAWSPKLLNLQVWTPTTKGQSKKKRGTVIIDDDEDDEDYVDPNYKEQDEQPEDQPEDDANEDAESLSASLQSVSMMCKPECQHRYMIVLLCFALQAIETADMATWHTHMSKMGRVVMQNRFCCSRTFLHFHPRNSRNAIPMFIGFSKSDEVGVRPAPGTQCWD